MLTIRNSKTRSLLYLSCPYSDPDPKIRIQRFNAVNKVAGELMSNEEVVFSPISQVPFTHPIAQEKNLPKNFEYWENMCKTYLFYSYKIIVLKFDGWEKSIGVQTEIKIAHEMGIPVEYMDI